MSKKTELVDNYLEQALENLLHQGILDNDQCQCARSELREKMFWAWDGGLEDGRSEGFQKAISTLENAWENSI